MCLGVWVCMYSGQSLSEAIEAKSWSPGDALYRSGTFYLEVYENLIRNIDSLKNIIVIASQPFG